MTAVELQDDERRGTDTSHLAGTPEAPLTGRPAWQVSLVRKLLVLDLIAAALGSNLALVVRFGATPSHFYELWSLLLPIVWVLTCASARGYEPRFLGSGSEEYRRVFDAGVRLLALTALLSYSLRLEIARLYVLVALPATLGLTLLLRHAARQGLRRRRARGQSLHRVIVTGRERACAELVRQLRREPAAGFLVVGACIDSAGGAEVEGVPVLGGSKDVTAALAATGGDTVAVGAWSDYSQSDLRRLSWELEGTGVSLVVAPSLTDIAGPRIHIRPVAGLPLLHVEEPEFRGGRRVLKASFDRGVSLVALVVLGPNQ